MTRFGYHVSHEQHPPSALLEYVRLAERAGFDGALSSDHLAPWLPENGHSGFAWSWLGAALEATGLTFGTVCAPGDRYHPVVIAQAAATLAEMYAGRFWVALGSGEAVNEHVTGNRWPAKGERRERVRECAEIMRALWRGETVVHRGLVQAVQARVYSLADRPPVLYGAAVSDDAAYWAGGWADGMITTGRPRDAMAKTLEAFRRGGGASKPVAVQHVLSWATTDTIARKQAHEQWRFAALSDENDAWNLRTPEEFDRATADVSVPAVAQKIPCSADLEFHIERLRAYAELGVDQVYIFNVGRNQREFIETFGGQVLPRLRESAAPAGASAPPAKAPAGRQRKRQATPKGKSSK